MRWRHPQRGVIPPSQFIPVAEATRLIIPLGAWSIQQACEDLALLPQHLRMAVNLSAVQFGSGDLVQTVRDALAETGLSPGRLELEVTETTLIQNPERAVAILNTLRGIGVRIAMDDFGTGYSSLSYLRNFPFDKIKIDKSFIDDLGHRRGSDAIVRAVALIASSVGIETVAEGVETQEQYRRVVAAGCDRVQGFLFGQAVSLAALPGAIAAIDAGRRSPRPRKIADKADGRALAQAK
jgi:EAL domain-containing protein (putative c-di-GMP-specific phosphodiesterase class I)